MIAPSITSPKKQIPSSGSSITRLCRYTLTCLTLTSFLHAGNEIIDLEIIPESAIQKVEGKILEARNVPENRKNVHIQKFNPKGKNRQLHLISVSNDESQAYGETYLKITGGHLPQYFEILGTFNENGRFKVIDVNYDGYDDLVYNTYNYNGTGSIHSKGVLILYNPKQDNYSVLRASGHSFNNNHSPNNFINLYTAGASGSGYAWYQYNSLCFFYENQLIPVVITTSYGPMKNLKVMASDGYRYLYLADEEAKIRPWAISDEWIENLCGMAIKSDFLSKDFLKSLPRRNLIAISQSLQDNGAKKKLYNIADELIKSSKKVSFPKTPVYLIKERDTLSALARRFKMSTVQIAEMNDIRDLDFIVAGNVLRLKK